MNRKLYIAVGIGVAVCLAMFLVLNYITRPLRGTTRDRDAEQISRLGVSRAPSGRSRHAMVEGLHYPPPGESPTEDETAASTGPSSDWDAILDEYVLSFYDDAARDAFIELARAKGIEVLDVIGLGHSVRIRSTSRRLLEQVLSESPPPTQWSHNYYVRSPLPSDLERQTPDGPYTGFGNMSLQWLGVPRNNALWGVGVTVAVLDTGVSLHPALAGSRISQIDFIEDTGDGAYAGHGTAVASLIAGNGEVDGIAPAADILSVKLMGDDGTGDTFTLAQGIVAAVDAGAQVLNLSLGTHGDSYILFEAVQYAIANGAVIVAATGNDAVNRVTYPASYEGVVAVTAVDGEGRHVYFANSGPEVDIAAPGVAVTAAATDGSVGQFSGTSAATPLVSGAIAGLLSQNPGMTGREAADILLAHGNDMGAPGTDPEYGRGVLDMGRVENRDVAGIYDVALGPPHVPAGTETPALVLYVQNRGTEILTSVDMPVEIDGVPSTVSFYDIGVGETASRLFYLDPAQISADGVHLTYSAAIDGPADRFPQNNAPREVLVGLIPVSEP